MKVWRSRQPELSRELATRFTDTNSYYVLEIIGLSAIEGCDLIASPAASSSSRPPTSSRTRRLRPISSGRPISLSRGHRLGLVLPSPPSSMTTRVHHRLGCTTMRANDIADTFNWRWRPGVATCKVVYNTACSSDNGSSLRLEQSRRMAKDRGAVRIRGAPCHPRTGQNRALAPDATQGTTSARELLLPDGLEAEDRALRRALQLHQAYHESLQNLTPADV